MTDEKGREGMETIKNEIGEKLRGRRHRIATLMARVDAGEREAFGELEDRIREECRYLDSGGKRDLAEAVRGWLRSRVEELGEAEGYVARRDDLAEAPWRWVGLRVRVSYVASRGLAHPTEIVGRLAGVTERGLHVLIDELEEERDGSAGHLAGSIARRMTAERLIFWPALLFAQPLPVLEEAVAGEQEESGTGKEDETQTNFAGEGLDEGYAALGKLIRRLRRARGWSMSKLAEESSLDLDTISNTEKARHRPRPETLERLVRSLGSPTTSFRDFRPADVPDEERAQRQSKSRIDL